ncbi:MAG: hypothetical protein ILP10_07375 [Lachnospiraceae bacterium]|nr:hypothetical protein [Lachnospiraceae bacterium]
MDDRAYIGILTTSLEEKTKVLDGLLEETLKQEEALAGETFDEAGFEASFAAKDKLLTRLEKLDEGFEEVYSHVSDELKERKDDYRAEIERLQELIADITRKSTSLQALEESNRKRLQIVLSAGRKKIKDFRVSNKTAVAYYKNMAGTHQDGQSYFCDKKK